LENTTARKKIQFLIESKFECKIHLNIQESKIHQLVGTAEVGIVVGPVPEGKKLGEVGTLSRKKCKRCRLGEVGIFVGLAVGFATEIFS
jgi:hypothetical protein